MAGGYADDIDDIVDIHFATVSLALELWGRRIPASLRSANDAVNGSGPDGGEPRRVAC